MSGERAAMLSAGRNDAAREALIDAERALSLVICPAGRETHETDIRKCEFALVKVRAAMAAPQPETAGVRERIAEAIYNVDPHFDGGEYVDGFQVSPGGNLSWEQAKKRDSEFGDDPLMGKITEFAYRCADALTSRSYADCAQEPTDDQITAGAAWLAENVLRMKWIGLRENGRAADGEFNPWVAHNARQEDYRDAVRGILAAMESARPDESYEQRKESGAEAFDPNLQADGDAEKLILDQRRLDWLQERIVDTIYLDDGKIIDVRGNSIRDAIDAAMSRWSGSLKDEEGYTKADGDAEERT